MALLWNICMWNCVILHEECLPTEVSWRSVCGCYTATKNEWATEHCLISHSTYHVNAFSVLIKVPKQWPYLTVQVNRLNDRLLSAEAIWRWLSVHPQCNQGYYNFNKALANHNNFDCGQTLATATATAILPPFYCPQALADGNYHIYIREKMLEFSSTVLSALSPPLVALCYSSY